jgi:hypothetical protein
MSRSIRSRRLLYAVVTCIVSVPAPGCGNSEPITSWKSPRLLRIEKEWQSLQDDARKMSAHERVKKYGLKNDKLYDALNDTIADQLSDDDMRRLVDSCGSIPVSVKDRSAFTNAVLTNIVRTSVASGDRERLVKLLSTRFLPRVGPVETIEFCLALRGKKLKGPILILGEAYERCQSPSVRHDIAAAVRRSFTDLGVRGKDDADFVKHAMDWYQKEKNNLVPNAGYSGNDDSFPLESYENDPTLYERHASRRAPLFKVKEWAR